MHSIQIGIAARPDVDLEVALCEYLPLVPTQSTRCHRSAGTASRDDLLINPRHQLIGQPNSDLRTHIPDGTNLGCIRTVSSRLDEQTHPSNGCIHRSGQSLIHYDMHRQPGELDRL